MDYLTEAYNDYWGLFNKLVAQLEATSKPDIVRQLRHAQLYLNGLTDGWYEFRDAFQKTITLHKSELNKEQTKMAKALLTHLTTRLDSQNKKPLSLQLSNFISKVFAFFRIPTKKH